MKDIKMSDVFDLPVESCVCVSDWTAITVTHSGLTDKEIDCIDYAINNHDRLVQERDELIERIQWLHQKLILEGKRYGASSSRMATQDLINKIQGGE